MSLFTIADPHLSLGCEKPMDIFGGWQDYVQRLSQNWRALVQPRDTVVVGGDISWAMNFDEALPDLQFLHALPGQKILLKGNHDYWWATMAKMNAFLQQHGLSTLHFLFNNSYEVEGVSLCGTRGWLFENEDEQDSKVMAREAGRLRASLEAATCGEKIAFLHYPPLSTDASSPQLIALLRRYGVRRCFYGHLHGASIRRAVQGCAAGIEYRLVSADALQFTPLYIPLTNNSLPVHK